MLLLREIIYPRSEGGPSSEDLLRFMSEAEEERE